MGKVVIIRGTKTDGVTNTELLSVEEIEADSARKVSTNAATSETGEFWRITVLGKHGVWVDFGIVDEVDPVPGASWFLAPGVHEFAATAGDLVAVLAEPTVGRPYILGSPKIVNEEGVLAVDMMYVGYPQPTLVYKWFADETLIEGQTDSTYTPVEADVGKMITVQVTATNDYGSDVSEEISFGPIEAPEE